MSRTKQNAEETAQERQQRLYVLRLRLQDALPHAVIQYDGSRGIVIIHDAGHTYNLTEVKEK
jgi:hypothetical protein